MMMRRKKETEKMTRDEIQNDRNTHIMVNLTPALVKEGVRRIGLTKSRGG
jgi:hypothetical protein